MTDSIVIIKNDHTGREVWRYPGVVLKKSAKGILVEAFFNRDDLAFNGILLKKNDRFIEAYLLGKWFNIYEIHDRDDDRLKAWYCNITRPIHLDKGRLSYDDLALDLLVYPDSRQLALDADEFSALNLPAREGRMAKSALEGLQDFFMKNFPPDLFSLL